MAKSSVDTKIILCKHVNAKSSSSISLILISLHCILKYFRILIAIVLLCLVKIPLVVSFYLSGHLLSWRNNSFQRNLLYEFVKIVYLLVPS